MALVIVASMVAVIVFWKGESTPGFYRARGVKWFVLVEEPIAIDAVEPLVEVFSAQVEEILRIPVYGAAFGRVSNDSRDSYQQYWGPVGGPIGLGPVEVPLNFFSGQQSRARGQLGPHYTTWWGMGVVSGVAIFVNTVACCVPDQIELLLHEFSHNLGLTDLYEGNDNGIQGCEGLPVMMAEGPSLNLDGTPGQPSGKLLFHYERVNQTPSQLIFDVRDSYLDRLQNRLTQAHHSWWSSGGTIALGNWRNVTYTLNDYRTWWTAEELRYLALPWASPYSCLQEGLP